MSTTLKKIAVIAFLFVALFSQLRLIDDKIEKWETKEKPVDPDARFAKLRNLLPPRTDIELISDATDTLELSVSQTEAQYALAPHIIYVNRQLPNVILDLRKPINQLRPLDYCTLQKVTPVKILDNGVILAKREIPQ
jgi:hypothetical protein